MDLITRHCSACGAERLFEQPPSRDGHRDESPEWACVRCGTAILVDPFLTDPLLHMGVERARRRERANAAGGRINQGSGRAGGRTERAPSRAA